jgi:hypothetical protein
VPHTLVRFNALRCSPSVVAAGLRVAQRSAAICNTQVRIMLSLLTAT